jgi:hypothetical protein
MFRGGRDSLLNRRGDSETEPLDGDRHESLDDGRLAGLSGAVRGVGVNLCHPRLLSRDSVEFPWLLGLIAEPRAGFASEPRAGLVVPRCAGTGVGGPKRRGTLLFVGAVLCGTEDVFGLPARSRPPKVLLGEPFCP